MFDIFSILMTEILKIGEHNVLMSVADSCRLDTAENANIPFLSSVSRLRHCETPATYTLPSHMAFFTGNLPVLVDGDPNYLPGIRQIWRSNNADASDKSIGMQFNGETVIEYYHQNNYNVIGAGGVSFFSSAKNNILPNLFPKFLHFERPQNKIKAENFPRTSEQFPLANIDKIICEVRDSMPFFVFINCPETHVPYDSPGAIISDEYRLAVQKIYEVDKCKHKLVSEVDRLNENERSAILEAQRQSLEWIDSKLKELYQALDNGLPTLLIAMSDHGEELGEGGRYGHAHHHAIVMNVPLWCGIIKTHSSVKNLIPFQP